MQPGSGPQRNPRVALRTIVREWGRIGCIGFGGPPVHITLLRKLCIPRGWLTDQEFEDGLAVANLLPGPSSTQLAIFCAWWVSGPVGALIGGVAFIAPGLVVILALAELFLSSHPPLAIEGAAAGAGAAVPAVALAAALALVAPSFKRAAGTSAGRFRWIVYALAGALSAALLGPWLVLVIVLCGAVEVILRRAPPDPPAQQDPPDRQDSPAAQDPPAPPDPPVPPGNPTKKSKPAIIGTLAAHAVTVGGLAALAWEALKVGALSFGGGFVIIPLMQHDAVHVYHFMSAQHFLDAVALGQVTPGPIVQTVAVVGLAAHGIVGALLAAVVAFAPSFIFVIAGGPHFDKVRQSPVAQAFLFGAGPAAIGAIAGSSIPLAQALTHLWEVGVLAAAAVWLLGFRRGIVTALVAAGVIGAIAALAGAPLST